MGTSSDGSFTGGVQTDWASTTSMGKMRLAADMPFGPNAGTGYIYGQLDMNGYSQAFKGLYSNTSGSTLKGEIFNNTDKRSPLTLNIAGIDQTYQGKINGNIELIVNADGAGKQTLNNNQSTFTGNVIVNGGTLVASAGWKSTDTTVFGDYISKTVTVNDGAELVFAAQDVVSKSSTNSPIQFIANAVFTDGAQLYAADGHANWKAYKLSSKVSVLRNADGSAAQPVTFSADMSKANATISFGNGTSIYVEDITSGSASAADVNSDLIVSALVTNPNQESNRTFYKDGTGILEFTAANTFNGTASIREGVLRLSGNGTLGTSTVTLGDKGTLELNVADGAEKSFTNKVAGTGSVAKTGAGTLKLDTANGFEASSLNVSAGRLDAFGTMTGDLAIADGASFSPGDGIGSLTLDGKLTANAGAQLVFEVDADASDLLVLGSGSTLDISEDAVLELLLNNAVPGVSYTLIESADGLGEYADPVFWAGLLSEESAYIWDFAVVGNTLQAAIDTNAVPEPATWVLLLLGASGLYCIRRKNAK